jgi:hypothetical protein
MTGWEAATAAAARATPWSRRAIRNSERIETLKRKANSGNRETVRLRIEPSNPASTKVRL